MYKRQILDISGSIPRLTLDQEDVLSQKEVKQINLSKHRFGFQSGFGGQKELLLPIDYSYTLWFFQMQYYYALHSRKHWGIELLTQPQYNITNFKILENTGDYTKGYEYGINIGILLRFNFFNDFMSIYGFASTGPHYIPKTPIRQAEGFIFSDNFFGGFHIRLVKNMFFDIRAGFRHVSNAGIEKPNGGINTHVISGGFMVNL